MTTSPEHTLANEDPVGSLFLFGADENPARYYESLRFQVMAGRGIGEGKTPDEIRELGARIDAVESEYTQAMSAAIGRRAVAS